MNRVGEIHMTNEGYRIIILEYLNYKNCTIKFDNGLIVTGKQYVDIKRGNIKNPYHLSVYGVGFLGEGIYSTENYKKSNTVWRSMLYRCYNLKYHSTLTYRSIKVCEEWHCFQVFAQWFENNYIEDFQLDKDILVKGNKIYSPETCCFVPREINSLFVKSDKVRGDYPIGVTPRGSMFRAKLNIRGKLKHLGSFTSSKEAFQAYKTAKEKYIKELANEYKGQITEQVYRILINYKVEITD